MTPRLLVGWALLCGRRSGTEVGVAIDDADFATLYRARNQDAEPAYQRVKNVITEHELPAGEKVFHSLVVHFEDELAIQLKDRFVRPDRAPDYLAQDFTQNTPNITCIYRTVCPAVETRGTTTAMPLRGNAASPTGLPGVDPGAPIVTETNASPVFFAEIQTQVDLDASHPQISGLSQTADHRM
jgi:hypothetical protein